MKHIMSPRSQIIELGKQLGVTTEQIHSILNNAQHLSEHPSFTHGPPRYCGSYYGTISINDFNIHKNTRKK